MATSPYQTLSNIRLGIIKDAKESTGAAFVAQVDRWINEGYEQVCYRKKRDWLDKTITVQVNSCVEQVCTVTAGSTTVTFSSGTFASGVELYFKNKGFDEIYKVSSATGSVLTLLNAYTGDTNTAANGVVFQPHVIMDSSIRNVYKVYHDYDQCTVQDIGNQQIRDLQLSQGVNFDYARYWTIFGQSDTTGSVGDRRLVLYPYPKKKYTLNYDGTIFITPLSAAADEPRIPMQHRQILYWYSLYKLYKYHRNDAQAESALGNFNSMLQRMDAENAAETEFPTLAVHYPRGQGRRSLLKGFNTRYRE